jgi:hypothetical protein
VSTSLTKAELRTIRETLAPLLVPPARPLTAEQMVQVGAVLERVDHVIANTRPAPERGELVFEWRVPREWALTLNQYAHKKGWAKKKLRAEMDAAILALLPAFPKAPTHGSQQPRWLRATRFSTKVVDDVSVDVLGGKMATDALVRCGVLADDDSTHLIREARSEKTKPGNTHLLMQVYMVVSEGAAADEPKDACVEQVRREAGFFTKAIVEGLE